jgi:exodeoxyribonuclease VII large subunit
VPERSDDKTIFSLLEVTQSIQRTLSERYKSAFWVKAEMNKLNLYRQSGHCYPELVEKKDGKIIAQLKACLWREDYQKVNASFQAVLNEPLKDGIKILFLAKLMFDPAHGLSLWIIDVDPAYTLGDLEREKQDTIRLLKENGLFDRNKTLHLPLLPKRIAIISVETSKGFADFTKVLGSNPWGYHFSLTLFPSLLQGDNAVSSIRHQLRRIKKVKEYFDVVAIIRGGGGDVGLTCYNNYDLAFEIATFPLPVITGIGHATNETVSEMISFTNAITPTKLAEFLLQTFHNFSVPVNDAQRKIADRANQILTNSKNAFRSEIKLFRSVTENMLMSHQNDVETISQSLVQQSRSVFRTEGQRLSVLRVNVSRAADLAWKDTERELILVARSFRKDLVLWLAKLHLQIDGIEKNVSNMSPEKVLQRGFSITFLNGKALRSSDDVREGDLVHTQLGRGEVKSRIERIEPNDQS